METLIDSRLTRLPDPVLPLDGAWEGSLLDRFLRHDRAQIAIEAIGESWSYGELEKASARVAGLLFPFLADGNRLVALYANRSPMLVVVLLGIVRAGAAFVILDPAYPLSRNAQCVALSKPVAFVNLLPTPLPVELLQGKPVLDLARPKVEWLRLHENFSGTSLAAKAESLDDVSYVAFTSGSTGVPKAILGTYRPVLHFIDWQQRQFGLNSKHRVSLLSGLGHDPLLRDIFMPLYVGATICVPPKACFEVPNRLFEWMRDYRVSVAHLTPSLGTMLLGSSKKSSGGTLDSLEFAFFGGEPLRPGLVTRLRQFAPRVTAVNCYGATETPQVMSFHVATQQGAEPIAEEDARVPVGKGIADTQLLVLDDDLRLCPPQEEGQICIRTPYLAKAVLDSTGKPIEVFKQNPFSSDPQDRIYLTGDYGYFRPDGTVVYVGRKDKQIKILGHRVQLEEIEAVLAAERELTSYQLVPETNEEGQINLVLYVVPVSAGGFDLLGLKRRLQARLPDFMVPSRISEVARIPLTPNGKVDLSRLKEMQPSGFDGPKQPANIPGNTEARVLRLFSRIICHPGLRPDDNLLDAGLNSLQAINACCAMEEEFGLTLSVQDIVQAQTANGLAALISNTRNDSVRRTGTESPRETASSQQPALVPESIRERHVRLLPRHENVLVGIKNRVFQLLARIAPDYLRVKLHRMRGVEIGEDVSIGYDTIVETAYPWLVKIGGHANIGMRVTILGHFRGMAAVEKGSHTVHIGEYAFIGPHVVILPNVTIGQGAVISAGSVVSGDIPPFVLAHGNPAVPVARCGVALAGETTYEEFMGKLQRL